MSTLDTIRVFTTDDETGAQVTVVHYAADISLKGWKSLFNGFIGGKLEELSHDHQTALAAAFAQNLHAAIPQ